MKSVLIAIGATLVAPVVHAQAVDTSFASSGQFTLELGGASSTSPQLIRESDGRIVSLAVTPAAEGMIASRDIVVTRLTSTGLPDSTFGTNGVAVIDLFGTEDRASRIAQQSDGKFVITGSTDVGAGDFDGIVLRLNQDGSLDRSFNGTGVLIVPLTVNGPDDNCSAVTLRSDNVIYTTCTQFGFNSASLVRIRPENGGLETDFANRGIVEFALGGVRAQPAGIVVDPISGAITLAATRLDDVDSAPKIFLNRFTATGLPDQAFGPTGTSAFGASGALVPIQATDLLRDRQGRLVVAGFQRDTSVTPAPILPFIARLNRDGISDGSFGSAGIVEIQATVGIAAATSLALQSDGKLVVGGFANRSPGDAGPVDPFVLQLTDDGRFDRTFAGVGITRVTFNDSEPTNRTALSLSTTPEGNIVLGGVQDMGVADTQRAFVIQLVKRNIGFSSDFASVAEGAGSVQLVLIRSGDTMSPGSVRVQTSSNGATAGEDFAALDEVVTFASGEVTKTIAITVINDSVDEPDETFLVNLTSPSENSFVDVGTATVSIMDDDEAAPAPPATDQPSSDPSPQPQPSTPAVPATRRGGGGGGAMGFEVLLFLGLLALARRLSRELRTAAR